MQIFIIWQRATESNRKQLRSLRLAGASNHHHGLLSNLEEGRGVEPLTHNGHSGIQHQLPAYLAVPSYGTPPQIRTGKP